MGNLASILDLAGVFNTLSRIQHVQSVGPGCQCKLQCCLLQEAKAAGDVVLQHPCLPLREFSLETNPRPLQTFLREAGNRHFALGRQKLAHYREAVVWYTLVRVR